MNQSLTPEEHEIMRHAFIFLKTHCNPPANSDDKAIEWWTQSYREMGAVSSAWNNHPLAIHVLIALMNYIEEKARIISKENREEIKKPSISESKRPVT